MSCNRTEKRLLVHAAPLRSLDFPHIGSYNFKTRSEAEMVPLVWKTELRSEQSRCMLIL